MQRAQRVVSLFGNHAYVGNRVAGLAFALFLFGAPLVHAALPSAQHNALVDLYNSTNGAKWTTRTNWLVAADECTWYGITCNTAHTTVQFIVLDGNNLSGPLPASLANLTSLRVLILSGNRLTGSIPSQLGTLTSLNGDLALGNNQLSGTIPAQLGNLTDLKQLILNDNQLSGGIPSQLGNLTKLQTLILADNRLTGSIPPQLGNLTDLQALTLMNNQLSGSIPAELGNLTNVLQIWLNNNRLSGAIPSRLGNLNALEYLVLDKNQLNGGIPSQLGNLTSLQHLRLHGNNLAGRIPASLTSLSHLNTAYLNWNALYSTDVALTDFLSARQNPNWGAWHATQTVAPKDVTTSAVTATSVTVKWTPIAYTSNEGFYQVYYSKTAGGPYTSFATKTSSKSAASLTVTGLVPDTRYYFVVKATTQSHSFNNNVVASELTAEISARTSASGPVANFDWQPKPATAGTTVQFTDRSSGNPTSWSWNFDDGQTSSKRDPSHTFQTAGTYEVELTVMNAAGSDREQKLVTIVGNPCPYPGWSDLKYATSSIGQSLEPLGKIPADHPTLHAPEIDAVLHDRVVAFTAKMASKEVFLERLSGYRPPDYQTHLHRVKTLHLAMHPLRNLPDVATNCRSQIDTVDEEVTRHDLSEDPTKLSVGSVSNHSSRQALDVALTPLPSDLKTLLKDAGLVAPCTKESSIHLQVIENSRCQPSTIVSAVASAQAGPAGIIHGSAGPLVPVRLMMRDPSGRRIGYDAATGQAVNEIGTSALYSGPESDPQVVTVSEAVEGQYHIEAVAISSGSYIIRVDAEDGEHGVSLASTSATGTAVPGVIIGPVSLEVPNPDLETPTRRRSVRH